MLQTINAKNFIQVIKSDKKIQSDLCGKWFSPKDSGKVLIQKAEKYLAAARKYVGYLEEVVKLNPNDLDAELKCSYLKSILDGASPEVRAEILADYQK